MIENLLLLFIILSIPSFLLLCFLDLSDENIDRIAKKHAEDILHKIYGKDWIIPSTVTPKPKADDFDTIEQYFDALSDWRIAAEKQLWQEDENDN